MRRAWRAVGRWPRSAKVVVLLLVVAIGVASSRTAEPPDRAPRGSSADSNATTTIAPPATTSAPTPTPTPTTGTPSPEATTTSPPATTTTLAVDLGQVDDLVVAAPDPSIPTYVRDRFGGDWSYDPATGCNTRELVLIDESLVPPQVDDRCRSTGGRWVSIYDGVAATDVAQLQIDHLVPLADAWRSGAWAWTDEQRLAFANDRTDPATLVAVTGSSNQSKSDSSPDRWLPPDRGTWCDYATSWVRVKARWQLTVTPAEKATLVQVLGGC